MSRLLEEPDDYLAWMFKVLEDRADALKRQD